MPVDSFHLKQKYLQVRGLHQPSQPASSMTSAVELLSSLCLMTLTPGKTRWAQDLLLGCQTQGEGQGPVPSRDCQVQGRKQSWETNTASLSVQRIWCRDHSSVKSVSSNGPWQTQGQGRSKVSHQLLTHRYWLFASNVRCAGNPADGFAKSLCVITRSNMMMVSTMMLVS